MRWCKCGKDGSWRGKVLFYKLGEKCDDCKDEVTQEEIDERHELEAKILKWLNNE